MSEKMIYPKTLPKMLHQKAAPFPDSLKPRIMLVDASPKDGWKRFHCLDCENVWIEERNEMTTHACKRSRP